MTKPFAVGIIAIALMCLHGGIAAGAERADVEKLLARSIVGPVLPLDEVQKYCDSRVPKINVPKSADAWRGEADELRKSILERIVYRGEAARWRDAKTKVEWLDTIDGGPGYQIQKLRFEILPNMWTVGLLYLPKEISGKVPVVLNVNGHTPLGKQSPPKQIRCINQAKRGMIALNVEWLGMGQLRSAGYSHARMNQLDLCGTSGWAPFYLSMKRSLDLLLELEHADPDRVAVTGLSGGGWQTIVISALDTRVKLSDPVAGYSSFRTRAYHLKDLGDSEQTPSDLAMLADYTHLTAMLAPRPALLTYNAKDNCCFESGYALKPLVDAAKPVYRLLDAESSFRTHVNHDPGTHNYERENREALYQMLGDFFYPGEKAYDAREIPSDDEVKSAKTLDIPLPESNEDFHTLAMKLSEKLPRDPHIPDDEPARTQWRKKRIVQLREIVRARVFSTEGRSESTEEKNGLKATFWKLLFDADWTVPAVELVEGTPKRTTFLIADAGRKSAGADVVRLLGEGDRVVAIDPSNVGESRVAQKAMLFSLLVATIGDRPLGLQASQIAAAARWSQSKHKTGPIRLVARGPRMAITALVAAALAPEAIGSVELHDSLDSLKRVIEKNWSVNQAPELFCFGLLESFDVEQLRALAK